ncbi:flagellar export protein FliJ [Alkalicoccobacillus porphyridii]|uniref:flagellar export protein FliJ n=1 Tax=Alkalicoccobacillus porphyridii TaxID=2597270 RepID=UPI00163D9070|nr:flagellar export protein FliJ [Alkalicoccobacillus porphyridii]
MGFHYSLQKLMDIKEREKETAESAYAEAVRTFEEVATTLYHLLKRKESLEADARARLEEQVSILDIQSMQTSMLFLQEAIQKQQLMTQQAREQMEWKQQQLVDASFEHKKHEKIREKKYMQFTLEEKRLDQMQMDEISIQRFVRQ